MLVVQPIFNLLIVLYSVIPGGDFGIAIVLFTVFVRFAMYPLTRSMLHQTRAMRKLQPELTRIKKQAGKNRQLAAMQQMELYKKHSINPFRPFGLLLIQLPIFLALYWVIQKFTSHRDQIGQFTYEFLKNIEPIKKLIENPDQFNEKLLGVVDLTKSAFHNGQVEIFLVVLALVAGVTQYVMSKQTMPHTENKRRLRDIMAEAAEGKQADQAEMNAVVMQNMTKILPVFMFFIMLGFPGAIALYYGTSNLVAVLQQAYLLKQDQEELSEIADEGAKKQGKKATAKAREKQAREASVTRITAKDTGRK